MTDPVSFNIFIEVDRHDVSLLVANVNIYGFVRSLFFLTTVVPKMYKPTTTELYLPKFYQKSGCFVKLSAEYMGERKI